MKMFSSMVSQWMVLSEATSFLNMAPSKQYHQHQTLSPAQTPRVLSILLSSHPLSDGPHSFLRYCLSTHRTMYSTNEIQIVLFIQIVFLIFLWILQIVVSPLVSHR